MGLTFYGANHREEIALTTPYADLPVELTEYLYANRASCPERASFFWELDPYGDAEFRGEALLSLTERCAVLLQEDWTACPGCAEVEQLREFFGELLMLCRAARQSGGAILALGD